MGGSRSFVKELNVLMGFGPCGQVRRSGLSWGGLLKLEVKVSLVPQR